ncbi:hypothetical protein K9M16_03670 [Candidatus Babeliales bacterium]|nr:hypothetical protein [Candidatus Babeliales bacterium]
MKFIKIFFLIFLLISALNSTKNFAIESDADNDNSSPNLNILCNHDQVSMQLPMHLINQSIFFAMIVKSGN